MNEFLHIYRCYGSIKDPVATVLNGSLVEVSSDSLRVNGVTVVRVPEIDGLVEAWVIE